MNEPERCPRCVEALPASDGTPCPACGAALIAAAVAAAPAPAAEAPLATVLAGGVASPPVEAAPSSRPRVWTVFTAFAAANLASLVSGVVVATAVIVTHAMRAHAAPTPGQLHDLLMGPRMFVLLGSLSAVASAAVALAAARLGAEGVPTRLALGERSPPAAVAGLACAAIIGWLLSFDALTTAVGVAPSGATEIIARALAAASRPGLRALVLFAAVVAVMAVLAPIGEELLYRGYIQRRLVQRWGTWPGILVTAALFGIAHLHPVQSAGAFAVGVLLGWITVRTGSIRTALLAHAVNNLTAALEVRLGLEPRTAVALALEGAVGLLLLAGGIWLLARRTAPAACSGP